jgi:glycine hydroxymethyltransferase
VKKICNEFGTILHYDGSHVLGLIAGGEFSQPLAEGADILLGSTHKTFPGPQGAVVLSSNRDNNPKYFKKVQRAIFPGLVSNHHLWRLPPLAITLLEMREFGAHYAKQVIANAQALAKALDRESIPVLAKSLGYTQSHQVLVDVAEFGGGGTAAKQLEIANIICNKNLLSKDDINKAMENPSGLRLGTQEMTRWGLKEGDMKTVAHFFRQIIIDKESPEKIQKEVISFRSKFDTIQFSLDGNK